MLLNSYYTIRFSDCDPLGHLNNSKHIDYILNAREDHLKEFHNIELMQFHRQEKSWVVGNHEIHYIKPAFYNEKVCIVTRLIELSESHLLVEGIIYDEAMVKVKTILWARFISISTKTGRKEDHSPDFMNMAAPLVDTTVNAKAGIRARIQELMNLQEKN